MKNNMLQRQILMLENIDYVEQIVKKLMKAMGLPASNYDEYISSGYIGLAEAAERFDANNGTTFQQYAFLRIRGAVIDNIRSNSIYIGKAYKMAKALQAINDLRINQIENDKNLSLSNIIHFASTSGILYQLCMEEAVDEVSLTSSESPNDILIKKETLQIIKEIISELPEKQKIIMQEYYYNDLTFTEISEKYSDMSKSWISRLHEKAIKKIHKKYLDRLRSS